MLETYKQKVHEISKTNSEIRDLAHANPYLFQENIVETIYQDKLFTYKLAKQLFNSSIISSTKLETLIIAQMKRMVKERNTTEAITDTMTSFY